MVAKSSSGNPTLLLLGWMGILCAPVLALPASRPATRPGAMKVLALPPGKLVMTYRDPWHEEKTANGKTKLVYAGRRFGILPLVTPIGSSAGGVYQAARAGTATPCVRHYLESLLERLMKTEDFKGIEPAGPLERIAGRGVVGVLKPMMANEGKGHYRYCGVAMFAYRGHAVALVCVARGGRNMRREQELFRRQLRCVSTPEYAAQDNPKSPVPIVYVQSVTADPQSPSELFSTKLENRRPRRLTRLNLRTREPIQAAAPRLSPNGRRILFASNLRGRINLYPWAIWAINRRSGAMRRLSGLIGNINLTREVEEGKAVTVIGIVTDKAGADGKPVKGALVFAGGMVKPSVSDAEGKFDIRVPRRGWTWLRIDPPRMAKGKPQPLRQTARWLKPRKERGNNAARIPLGPAGAPQPQDLMLGQPVMDASGTVYWIRRLRRLGAGTPAISADFPWDLRMTAKPISLQNANQLQGGGDPSRGYWLDESQLWRLVRSEHGWIELPVTTRFWGRNPCPVFSRNGKWMAIKTCRPAVNLNIKSQPAYQDSATVLLASITSGKTPWKLETLELFVSATGGLAFTPDGKELLFVADGKADAGAAGNLMALDLARRTTRQLTHWRRPAIGGVSPSPDGRRIAFDAQHMPPRAKASDPMRTDIYVIPSIGGVATRITSNGVSSQPAWSGP